MAKQEYITYFYRKDITGQKLADAVKAFIKSKYHANTNITIEPESYYLEVTPQKSKKPQLFIRII